METKFEIVPVPTRILTHHDDIVHRAGPNAVRILSQVCWQRFCAVYFRPRAVSLAGIVCRL